jgi:tetratricopeptide (TPR) repeat protein
MDRALVLALEQGRGRDVAVIHNNLALAVWQYEGPQAALERCRYGIEFCERRGIAEFALGIAVISLTLLVEGGRPGEAVAEAEPLAERAEAAGSVSDVVEARSLRLRLLSQRGEGQHDVLAGEPLAAAARKTGEPQLIALGFAADAQLLVARGRPQQAQTLLAELEQVPGTRGDPYYASLLPELVRTTLALGDTELAARLVAGVEPTMPLVEHALCACRGELAEAAGEQAEATALYAEAAERWQQFGNVPERAYALLGHGRCLLALGQPAAELPLAQARELFQTMGYKPALEETEALLQQTTAAAS